MPRPRKGRRVCSLPRANYFGPLDVIAKGEEVIMTVEEYETIRLLDLEGLTQEEVAEQMDVARTTVQRMYASARQKVAQTLFDGSILRIEGGDYQLHSHSGPGRGCARCARQGHGQGRGLGRQQ